MIFRIIFSVLLFFPIISICQSDSSGKQKTTTTKSSNTTFFNAEKNIVSPSNYMSLANSGLYEISYKKINDTLLVYHLDSTTLLKTLNKKFSFDGLKDLQGKKIKFNHKQIVIINFWSTTCKPCIEEIDSLNMLVKQYPSINFLAITPDSLSTVISFLNKKWFAYNICFLSEPLIDTLFQVKIYPTHLLFNKEMVLKKILVGRNEMPNTHIKNFIFENISEN